LLIAMETTVRDNPEESRYEIRDGDRVLGLAAYQRRGDTTVFTHTEVDPDAGQDGLGSTLVRAALDDVRSRGGSVVPQCPFVRGWIERHQDYADLVASSRR
jgi:predicted GNAT family acetyltransferase